jgi:hypothetical protein
LKLEHKDETATHLRPGRLKTRKKGGSLRLPP